MQTEKSTQPVDLPLLEQKVEESVLAALKVSQALDKRDGESRPMHSTARHGAIMAYTHLSEHIIAMMKL